MSVNFIFQNRMRKWSILPTSQTLISRVLSEWTYKEKTKTTKTLENKRKQKCWAARTLCSDAENPTVEGTEAEVTHVGCRYSVALDSRKHWNVWHKPIAHRLGCTHKRVFFVKLGVIKSINMNNLLFLTARWMEIHD
jgi:hypothetical protein